MLSKIIGFSIKNKALVFLFVAGILGFGIYSITQLSIGAVPDVTNNQVQVITTSRNLSTQDIEQFITYPVELEMANLPGVKEIRSVSKFGLSVVTIVFEESMGTYLPRQLIAEKIKSAAEKIPEGFGSPEMGPITTGLGEIYQYILDVDSSYEGKYSITELRTIQDWIVKRQLSGIRGVVEVNTWGGYLKQYEVAVNTQKLNAMNITIGEVFSALENNNSVAGGGYIEKTNQAYFIRGEGLVKSLKDIENIIVKKVGEVPIYIRDVAKVGFGSATRFGAITANGKGEKVMGQIMMLKDGNSKQVIDAIKTRVAEINKHLPAGISINPFLERSELIGKTMFTVVENLVLGCLIVIFVVVVLLGNMRSGLIVASVIPVSLLFAISLMNIFGVDANLLSLGAIDFGIIIDGAVIIVEFTTFKMVQNASKINALNKTDQQELKNEISYSSSSTMMSSAIFGQIIILIVFIPILSLSGVEGKMFKPMALVFSFALVGAMLLCLTYVPVMASIFLKPEEENKNNFSSKLINTITKFYHPTITWAMKNKKLVITSAAVLLVGAVIIFSRMGGEFVPTLDEGDFVIQPVLKTGTSLSQTIETTTQIEQILLKNFPEVKQVVSRIGAAEVPTDPMSMEESDVIITLKPKKEWVNADTKDGLAEKIKEKLEIIPGLEIEFTQPIEMRFNELITGVRADIAVKVFGEDLAILEQKGNEVKELIKHVEGAEDIIVEKTAGLPQMNVNYKRDKIARYGINISDVNKVLTMSFAGQTVGTVFEGEKRFDLVVRLDKDYRKSIDDIKNLYIDLPDGDKIPLQELAEITYKKGAAKISRDDTKRRIVVGINVRNRDLQSVVDEIEGILSEKLNLPVGYSVSYGGQFENLQNASKRLSIAVPIALALIFILLFLAFHSFKDTILIFTAIPFAAIGGIVLLWVRGLPFSISAGVGFIALFGIAVLNGIVLIEHYKTLKLEDFNSLNDLVVKGVKDRLRAVLLTATAAALGFLPMAISSSAGAEVQRPLATVVIGGLVTSTLLTLIVLPVLYSLLFKVKASKRLISSVAMLFFSINAFAQQASLSLADLEDLALNNNAKIQAEKLKIDSKEAFIKSAFHIDKTNVYFSRDENNLAINNRALNVFGVEQNFKFPSVYFTQQKLNEIDYQLQSIDYTIQEKMIKKELEKAYNNYQIKKEQEQIFQRLDSIYSSFAKAAKRKFELGSTNYLEKITASTKQQQIKQQYNQAKLESDIAYKEICALVQVEDSLLIKYEPVAKLTIQAVDIDNLPELSYQESKNKLISKQVNLEKQQLLPDINLAYFQGTNPTLNGWLRGYQVGLNVPLFFNGQASKIKVAKINTAIQEQESENYKIQIETHLAILLKELEKDKAALTYYESEGNFLADEILKTATKSFKQGEIDFFQYILSLENAYTMKIDYLNKLNSYNSTITSINYLTY